ncbi:O-antigen ligase family protein [Thalassobacillus hwangdonensis]|uniref:O-antigen ligase family protein n=1 Tax=Thalassobacillus hwangdonensis TaxID=546108 RepID=A0ABW3L7F0_9BACI
MMVMNERKLLVILFAAGIVLTNATQLRFAGLPIGPGELLLVVWMGVVFLQLRYQKALHIKDSLLLYWLLWGMLLFCFFWGTMISLYQQVWQSASYYNLLAYLFSLMIISCLSLSGIDIKRVMKLVFYFTAIPISLLVIAYQFSSGLGPIWFGGVRFMGWSTNPNQLAFFLCMILFIGVYHFFESRSLMEKGMLIVLCGGVCFAGIETESDALKAAWASSFGVFLFLSWINQVMVKRSSYATGMLVKIILPLLVLFFLIFFGKSMFLEISSTIQNVFSEGDQGEDRVTLWINGILAVFTSPLFGLGPGTYSGIFGPFTGMEAHNTFIDLVTNAGMVGMVIYVIFMFIVYWRTILAKEWLLLSALIALSVYSMFHFVLRYPLYWLFLFFVLSIAIDSDEASGRHRRTVVNKRFKEE